MSIAVYPFSPTGTAYIPPTPQDTYQTQRVQQSSDFIQSLINAVQSQYGSGYILENTRPFNLNDSFEDRYPITAENFRIIPISQSPGYAEPNTSRIILPFSDYVAEQGIFGRIANAITGVVLTAGVADGYGALSTPTSAPVGVAGPPTSTGGFYTGSETAYSGFSASAVIQAPTFPFEPGLNYSTASTAYGAYSFIAPYLGNNAITRAIDNVIGNIFRVIGGQSISIAQAPQIRPSSPFASYGNSGGGGGSGLGIAANTGQSQSSSLVYPVLGLAAIVLLLVFVRKK